jgi:hypothetical protein
MIISRYSRFAIMRLKKACTTEQRPARGRNSGYWGFIEARAGKGSQGQTTDDG